MKKLLTIIAIALFSTWSHGHEVIVQRIDKGTGFPHEEKSFPNWKMEWEKVFAPDGKVTHFRVNLSDGNNQTEHITYIKVYSVKGGNENAYVVTGSVEGGEEITIYFWKKENLIVYEYAEYNMLHYGNVNYPKEM